MLLTIHNNYKNHRMLCFLFSHYFDFVTELTILIDYPLEEIQEIALMRSIIEKKRYRPFPSQEGVIHFFYSLRYPLKNYLKVIKNTRTIHYSMISLSPNVFSMTVHNYEEKYNDSFITFSTI